MFLRYDALFYFFQCERINFPDKPLCREAKLVWIRYSVFKKHAKPIFRYKLLKTLFGKIMTPFCCLRNTNPDNQRNEKYKSLEIIHQHTGQEDNSKRNGKFFFPNSSLKRRYVCKNFYFTRVDRLSQIVNNFRFINSKL